jgi:hypothetical protein
VSGRFPSYGKREQPTQVVVALSEREFIKELHKIGVGFQAVGFGCFDKGIQAGTRSGAAR